MQVSVVISVVAFALGTMGAIKGQPWFCGAFYLLVLASRWGQPGVWRWLGNCQSFAAASYLFYVDSHPLAIVALVIGVLLSSFRDLLFSADGWSFELFGGDDVGGGGDGGSDGGSGSD